MKKNRLLLSLIFILAGVVSLSAKGTVQLRLVVPDGGSEIAVGEKFYIYYKLDNVSADPSEPASVPGSNKLSFNFSSSSSSIVSVNGKTEQTSSRTYVLYARAKIEGNYSFGPVTVGGVKSNTINFKIVKQRNGSSSSYPSSSAMQGSNGQASSDAGESDSPTFIGKGDSHLFLKASVNRTKVYEQEALEYTVKLYTTYSRIKFVGATESPKFDGFVVEETKDTSTSFSYETYNGQTYATAVIARYVIFPQKAGQLKITGNTYTVSADRSEYFSDSYFSHMTVYRPIQLNVKPNDLIINVSELPSPRPADFSGAVGQFSISSSLPSANLLTNHAASIVYTVSGKGNIKYVKLPELNDIFPAQLEVFSPKTDVESNVGTSNVSGSVKFDYSFMPFEVGKYRIPELSFVYFDPLTGRYERAVAKGYDVSVSQGASSDKSQTKEKLRFDSDLLPVGDNLSKIHTPFILQWGYWMFYIIPALGLGGVYIIWRNRRRLMADEIAFRSRKAGKVATRRLKKALQCIKSKDEEHFFDEMLNAIFGYIGDKLKMPTSEITRDNVKSMLESNGIGNDISTQLIDVINECEFAKYSSSGAASDMGTIYDRGCRVIEALEKVFASSGKSPVISATSKNEPNV